MINSDCGQDITMCFAKIVIMGVHTSDSSDPCNAEDQDHFHIVGEQKWSTRFLRDMSTKRLERLNSGLSPGIRDAFCAARAKYILDEQHFKNTIEYVRKRCSNIIEDNCDTFHFTNKFMIFKMIDEMTEPSDISQEEQEEFNKRYPVAWQWTIDSQNYAFPKTVVKRLKQLEAARARENTLPPAVETMNKAISENRFLCKYLVTVKEALESFGGVTGKCLILCGPSDTCKSTILRIVAHSFGKFAVWPGSQFIERDALKFDSLVRNRIDQLVVEEMQWYDMPRKHTIEKTILGIKELMTGGGLDVRTSKAGAQVLTGEAKLSLRHIFISMNPDSMANFKALHHIINSKQEYKKRLMILDTTSWEHDMQMQRSRTSCAWETPEKATEQEVLLGKVLGHYSCDQISEIINDTELLEIPETLDN